MNSSEPRRPVHRRSWWWTVLWFVVGALLAQIYIHVFLEPS